METDSLEGNYRIRDPAANLGTAHPRYSLNKGQ